VTVKKTENDTSVFSPLGSVQRWEMRPGSTLYLVWQQERSEEEALASPARVSDVFESLTSVGNNYFAIKMSYWLAQ